MVDSCSIPAIGQLIQSDLVFLQSLCNACGIRYRKRRRVAMGLDPEVKRKPKREAPEAAAAAKATASSAAEAENAAAQEKDGEQGDDNEKASSATTKTQTVELHMVGFAKDAVLKQRRRMCQRRKPSCLAEEQVVVCVKE